MRYIRTKNRIIDLEREVYGNKVIHLNENELEDGNWSGWYWNTDEYGYEIECRDADIIKQANTIEELCDEFVGVLDNGSGSHIWYNDEYCGMDTTEYLEIEDKFYKSILCNAVKRNRCENEIIYGAIWTDEGLIYVAKMNENGDLELL